MIGLSHLPVFFNLCLSRVLNNLRLYIFVELQKISKHHNEIKEELQIYPCPSVSVSVSDCSCTIFHIRIHRGWWSNKHTELFSSSCPCLVTAVSNTAGCLGTLLVSLLYLPKLQPCHIWSSPDCCTSAMYCATLLKVKFWQQRRQYCTFFNAIKKNLHGSPAQGLMVIVGSNWW